jgi:hypothetical protein
MFDRYISNICRLVVNLCGVTGSDKHSSLLQYITESITLALAKLCTYVCTHDALPLRQKKGLRVLENFLHFNLPLKQCGLTDNL